MTGIIFATEIEAKPFLGLVGAAQRRDAELPTWSFTLGKRRFVLVISGMGAENAAVATRRLLARHAVTEVVNAGVCGAVADGPGPGDVFRIASVVDADRTQSDIDCVSTRWPHLAEAKLVTSREPVFDDLQRRNLALAGDLVDMEGAAVAAACRERGVPCQMLKAVTDRAASGDRSTLFANIAAVARKLAGELATGLDRPVALPLRDGRTSDETGGMAAKLARFVKFEHSVFSLPMVLVGAWLGAGKALPSWMTLLLICAAAVGARVFGMAMNRILDRKLDAANPRTCQRELPTGRLSLRAAMTMAMAGLGVYLAACAMLGPTVLMLSPLPVVVLAGYSLLKRFTALCHFGIGLVLAIAPLGAHVAVAGNLAVGPEIMLLSVFAFCWMSGFDVIYGLQDIQSDRTTGVHSLPAALGARPAETAAIFIHACAVAAAGILFVIGGGRWLAAIALGVTGAAFIYAHLPHIPLERRFFPVSAIAGSAGALIPLFGG